MVTENAGISQKDAEAFATKLEAWSQSLEAKERALLHVLLKSAESGVPGGAQLSDEQLEGVAGGVIGDCGIASPLQARALKVFSKFIAVNPLEIMSRRN